MPHPMVKKSHDEEAENVLAESCCLSHLVVHVLPATSSSPSLRKIIETFSTGGVCMVLPFA